MMTASYSKVCSTDPLFFFRILQEGNMGSTDVVEPPKYITGNYYIFSLSPAVEVDKHA